MRFLHLVAGLALLATDSACQRVPEPGLQALGSARTPTASVASARPAGSSHLVAPTVSRESASLARAVEPFALVELFTSEGCSSCPPADAHLAAIAERADRAGERVYTLELHVDYWDSADFADPFSAPAYSDRQRAYATAFKLNELFTPEVVVNGHKVVVGTHHAEVDAAIGEALRTPGTVELEVRARPGKARGEITVDYGVRGCPDGCTLNVALVQDRAETQVAGGENRTRILPHRHVVRALYTRALTGDGRGSIPTEWQEPGRTAALAVAFVSATGSGAILGARAVSLEQS